jgi:hypothetical protein
MQACSINRAGIWHIAFIALLLFQVIFWSQTRHIKPELEIVPAVPGKAALDAMSFGDNAFYFRVLALKLQNAGDSYGRFTPLKDYDYHKLALWFGLLDGLDNRSNMVPFMASYYFSQTQNVQDVRYIVDYLYAHATRDIEHKWWWLLQAIYLSIHRLNDMDLALKVATPLVNDKVPAWAQQMAAVVHEKRGEMDDALRIMETIQRHSKDIPEADLRYMEYFVKERLERMEKLSNP